MILATQPMLTPLRPQSLSVHGNYDYVQKLTTKAWWDFCRYLHICPIIRAQELIFDELNMRCYAMIATNLGVVDLVLTVDPTQDLTNRWVPTIATYTGFGCMRGVWCDILNGEFTRTTTDGWFGPE